MKRSQINAAIRLATETLDTRSFHLPSFACWTPEQWTVQGAECNRIRINRLGWDVTDFGAGDFDIYGATLFTLRNGNHRLPEQGTPYAEKVIILKPGQRLPLHFHWVKTEDVINRGGGILVVELYHSLADETVDRESPVVFFCDGVERVAAPGEYLEFGPGESITLAPHVYHRFWAKKNGGVLICGEVSAVNDDRVDNCFAETVSRFADVEEDEAVLHLLCNEYPECPDWESEQT